MNAQQQELVVELVCNRISPETFVELFFQGEGMPEDYVYTELKTAFESKDAGSVEGVLNLGFMSSFPPGCEEILCRLLVCDWHYRHEDVALALQEFNYPAAVDSFYEAALAQHSYIGSEYSLGVKCVYALRDIGTPQAREKLQALTHASHPELSERAIRFIKEWK